jgi:hypothetical protein
MFAKARVVKLWNSSMYTKKSRRSLGGVSALLKAASPIVVTSNPPRRFELSSPMCPLARLTKSTCPWSMIRRCASPFLGPSISDRALGQQEKLRPCSGLVPCRPRGSRRKTFQIPSIGTCGRCHFGATCSVLFIPSEAEQYSRAASSFDRSCPTRPDRR